jgi:hypothetical protein
MGPRHLGPRSLVARTVLVKLLRMGTSFGGVLSEVGTKHRDGGVGCPRCDSDGFVPVRFERWVVCESCRTVFVQRRSKHLEQLFSEGVKEVIDRTPKRHR